MADRKGEIFGAGHASTIYTETTNLRTSLSVHSFYVHTSVVSHLDLSKVIIQYAYRVHWEYRHVVYKSRSGPIDRTKHGMCIALPFELFLTHNWEVPLKR